jgi:hypothetical protein
MNIRSAIIGTTLLVVLLTAGAAQSLSGSNTVFTDDIVNGQVRNEDIAANAIGGGRVNDNSLTGADVNESTLVPTCPTNMTRVADVCYGSARAANNQFFALFDCADENLRLPSISEGLLITAITGGAIWTDEISSGPIYVVSNSYSTDANNHSYFCVTTVGARP